MNLQLCLSHSYIPLHFIKKIKKTDLDITTVKFSGANSKYEKFRIFLKLKKYNLILQNFCWKVMTFLVLQVHNLRNLSQILREINNGRFNIALFIFSDIFRNLILMKLYNSLGRNFPKSKFSIPKNFKMCKFWKLIWCNYLIKNSKL